MSLAFRRAKLCGDTHRGVKKSNTDTKRSFGDDLMTHGVEELRRKKCDVLEPYMVTETVLIENYKKRPSIYDEQAGRSLPEKLPEIGNSSKGNGDKEDMKCHRDESSLSQL